MAGIFWPNKFDVWASLHPEWMDGYRAKRKAQGFPCGFEVVAPLEGELGKEHAKHPVDRRVSYRWPGMNASASSGIYGAKIALDDGHDRVVLAGIPMQADDGHFSRGKNWNQCDAFLSGLRHSIPYMQGKVKSMSGLTAELLGKPSPEWLTGEP